MRGAKGIVLSPTTNPTKFVQEINSPKFIKFVLVDSVEHAKVYPCHGWNLAKVLAETHLEMSLTDHQIEWQPVLSK